MTVVSGATLKTSMGTAETALDTLIGTPTITNRDAALAALDTVIVDARDSRLISATDAKGKIHANFQANAVALRQEILNSSQHHASATQPVGPSAIYRSIKKTYLAGGAHWQQYKTAATTD